MRKSRRLFARLFALAFAIVVLPIADYGTAQANWLSALTKGASKAGRHLDTELGAVGRAARHLGELPADAKGALAAHATPEGHWQFVNKDGQKFTAGTTDELKSVVPALVPEGLPGDGKLSLYLSEDSVFANRAHLDKLPKDAKLSLVTEHGAYPLTRGAGGELKLAFRPNLSVDLADARLLNETLSVLTRPLNKSNIRTLALEPGAAASLSTAPRLDPVSKAPLVDAIDPAALSQSFSAMRGQTALLVGRVEKGQIFFQPAKGGEVARDLAEIAEAASRSDVNLVVLHAQAPRQPGGRNWLWQSIEVGGLNEAVAKSTYGDFLEALGARRSPLSVSAADDGVGRVHIKAAQDAATKPVEEVQSAFGELMSHVTGELITNAADIHTRDTSNQSEFDARIIPGIPSYIQIPYLVNVVLGILGWAVSRHWWSKLWPGPEREAGRSLAGHAVRALPNFLVYLLLFLPVAGGFAFIWTMLLQLWASVTAPFKWLAKIFRRRVEV